MFNLPQEVKKDIETYRNSLELFIQGKISSARFKGIRVPWGIYSHRGAKLYMSRIRIPAGIINPIQLKAISLASQRYADGILHLTTRQDIQIHNVKIQDTYRLIDYLKEYNLSPRGGGGNTIRNIIACPLAGICKDEIFDVRGYAISLTEYLLSEESSFSLPRKFKISFSGCNKDCAGCLVNDLGLLADYKNTQRGFKVFVGGGMGANSRIGRLLEEFILDQDLGYCVKAVKNVFYRYGDRRNKHHNRLRFLIEDMGLEKFKQLYKKEFQALKTKEYIFLRKIEFPHKKILNKSFSLNDDREYREFLRYNTISQKQEGFSVVTLRIPQGDISSEKMIFLADLQEEFKGIEFRTSQNQNLLICWVRNQDLYKLFLRLKGRLSDFLYPNTLLDVVVCKGALTCNLGLCNSPGLAREIERIIKKEFLGKEIFTSLQIKLNGCPNSCGQHPVGNISFYGLARRVNDRAVPFYKLLLGGRKKAQYTKLAQEIGIIPAKNVPLFLREFLKCLEDKIKGIKDIFEFLDTEGKGLAESLLKKYSYVPSYLEDKGFYIDWEKEEEFSLEGLGPGECGAGVLDMIEADLIEAELSLKEAEKSSYNPQKIKEALVCTARALLVVKGSDPKSTQEVFSEFKQKFIKEGIASESYSDIQNFYESISNDLDLDKRKQAFYYAKQFFEHISKLYKSMDSSFSFPQLKKPKPVMHILDLKGTPCPLNYVKAKLALEDLPVGETLQVILDEGEPIKNVPKSLENDGYKILKIEKLDSTYRVLVKK